MDDFIADLTHEFRRQKAMAERAIPNLNDEQFFHRPGEQVNNVALIVKHLAGNMASRWSDFLTTDGEKPTRDRDSEFVITDADTRASLMTAWDRGWTILLETLAGLTDADLQATVTIRGEAQSARQALLRGMSHVAYHVGQVLYLVRLLQPDSPWQTIPPGQSRAARGNYRAL
jgi:uncharacterized damage-inducible protein DinB